MALSLKDIRRVQENAAKLPAYINVWQWDECVIVQSQIKYVTREACVRAAARTLRMYNGAGLRLAYRIVVRAKP